MTTKVNITMSLKAGLFAALSAALFNTILFFIFHETGIFSDTVFIQPGQPLSLLPVLISSIIPTLIASVVFFLIEKYSVKGFKIFRVLAIVLLLLSFINPFMGIQGVTVLYGLALNLMHVVVVVALLYFLKKAVDSVQTDRI